MKRLGADHVVDHTKDLGSQLELVGDGTVTAIAHATGDPGTLARVLAPGGRMVSAVGATAEQAGRADVDVAAIMAVPS